MTEHYSDDRVIVYQGDCREVMAEMDDECIDAIVCDPPYGLEFMGVAWDTMGKGGSRPRNEWEDFGSREHPRDARSSARIRRNKSVAFERFCAEWAGEALRVLKPGGHLLAFGGSRTWHRMAVAIEDAGFEMRDSIAWLYGSGFPKSMDVSKAIDKQRDDTGDVRVICRWLRARIKDSDHTTKTLAEVFGFNPRMVEHWAARDTDSQPTLPTLDQWDRLRDLLGFDDSQDAEVYRLNIRKGEPGEAWAARPVIGNVQVWDNRTAYAMTSRDGLQRGDTVNPAAKQWQGWGTALKPAFEPIVVARKPLGEKTVAANVLEHGTGALNIDACRVAGEVPRTVQGQSQNAGQLYGADQRDQRVFEPNDGGRWPTNVLLDGTREPLVQLKDTVPIEVAQVIREFFGASPSSMPAVRNSDNSPSISGVETQILHTSVSIDMDVRESARRECAPTRKGAHGRVSREDAPIREGEQLARGTVSELEGRSSHGQWLCDGECINPDRRGTNVPCIDDLQQPDTRAPIGDGPFNGSPTTSERAGASRQWNTDGQPSGESGTARSGISQQGACTSSGRDSTTAGRELSAASHSLVVVRSAVPDAWSHYFESAGLETQSMADALDEQSGISKSKRSARGAGKSETETYGEPTARGEQRFGPSEGGASRFFPTFRYQAKAPARERPKVDGVAHPTVKPLELMRWLIRLVTPPEGVLLDPFAGSGTTLEAAMMEGVLAIGIEFDPSHLPLIMHRIERQTTT